MEENRELEFAWDFIEKTGTGLFLTGRAGTGKTTFLRRLKEKSPKRMIVLAPTGIAAINAGGMTIHSFFQLPFAPFIPESSFRTGKGSYRFRFGKEKTRLIRSLDLLVIDEISMVRADLLDAVDLVLRKFRDRDKPFGGVQLLMIGDLQQLAPVVREEEWMMLKDYYETPYFFSSKALGNMDYCTVELSTVYRQKDRVFLDLLNSIRENRCSRQDLNLLNSRYIPGFSPSGNEGYIRLVTHNRQARQINETELGRLSGESVFFDAEIEGTFPEYSFPADKTLELKRGAQVMFVKNDISKERRYFNGLLGEVVEISEGQISVRRHDNGDIVNLKQEEWTNAKYVLDEDTREIREEIEGTFRQYPLRLAWAITIHKSQGLTFDRAVIDAGCAFSHGQTYVALSRCRTLEGLVLGSLLSERAIITDAAVEKFTEQSRRNIPDGKRLEYLEKNYYYELLSGLFDFSPLLTAGKRYLRFADEAFYRIYPQEIARYKTALVDFTEKTAEVAVKFRRQYGRIISNSPDYASDSNLQERIHAGAGYFKERLEMARTVFSGALTASDNKDTAKRLSEFLKEFNSGLELKIRLLDHVLEKGFDVASYLKRKAFLMLEADTAAGKSRRKQGQGAASGKKSSGSGAVIIPSDIIHPELYHRLVAWRNSEAAARKVPAYVVMRQKAILGISNLLPDSMDALVGIPYFGKQGAEKYGAAILEIVEKYRSGHSGQA